MSAAALVVVVLASAAVVVVALYDLSNVNDRVADVNSSSSIIQASTGIGLYVVLIGGGVGLVGALLSLQNRAPNEQAESAPPPAPIA